MNLSQFISTYIGEAVDVDGITADTGQCVQLVALYCQKVLNFTLPDVVGAIDLWTNPTILSHFTQISAGKEQSGDITVWGASTLINSPTYGHTDIVVIPGFTGFDSNWGGVVQTATGPGLGFPAAHEVNHTYQDVLGFLRFKGEVMEDLVNSGDVHNIYEVLLGRADTPADDAAWVGQTWKVFISGVLSSPEFAAHQASLGTVDKTNVLTYIEANLQ